MELTAIIAGLLLAAGGLVVLAGLALHAWVSGRQDLLGAATRLASELPGRLGRLGRLPGHNRPQRVTGPGPGSAEGALVLSLILGLAVVALAAVGVGKLVDDVTDGDGVAVLDHPVARFVAAHRAPALTSVMDAASTVGGPVGMAVLALAAGLLLGVTWRSWTPVVVLGATVAG